ncbi:MAG: hypothetical protein ACXIUM_11685 [Wenzhouxiangella sp.]
MTWVQALIVALVTYVVTKSMDLITQRFVEPREFRKLRRQRALNDLESLMDEIGTLCELAASWKSEKRKVLGYKELLKIDHKLVGRLHKYGPEVAGAGRNTLHYCMLVADSEFKKSDDLQSTKQALHEKREDFLKVCNAYLENLV